MSEEKNQEILGSIREPRVKIRHRKGKYFLFVGSEVIQIRGCTVKTTENGEMLLVVRIQGNADMFEVASVEDMPG